MTQKVICDGCGAQDDWADETSAYFPSGGQLLIRREGGFRDGTTWDLCASCIRTILEALPQLKQTFKERS